MTPRKPANHNNPLNTPLTKIFITVVAAGFIGFFAFLWNLNQQLAIMQSNDKYREERVKDIDKNVSTLVNEMQNMKVRDMQELKDRLKTLEVQNEKNK